jgi:hypothetical protein
MPRASIPGCTRCSDPSPSEDNCGLYQTGADNIKLFLMHDLMVSKDEETRDRREKGNFEGSSARLGPKSSPRLHCYYTVRKHVLWLLVVARDHEMTRNVNCISTFRH